MFAASLSHMTVITQLQHSFQKISSWMTANLLTLNSSKTEFRLVGLPQQLAKVNTSSLITTHSARNLGSIFDEQHTFSDQIPALSLNLAIIILVNFAVFVFILTSKLPVPSPLLSFILNLTTATHCIIIFHSLRWKKNSRTSRILLLVLSPVRQNLLTSLLFWNLYTGWK